jgi:hypothetical protein
MKTNKIVHTSEVRAEYGWAFEPREASWSAAALRRSCARDAHEPPKALVRSTAVLKSPQSKRWRDCEWTTVPRGAFWSAPVSGAATFSNPPALEKPVASRIACGAADESSARQVVALSLWLIPRGRWRCVRRGGTDPGFNVAAEGTAALQRRLPQSKRRQGHSKQV